MSTKIAIIGAGGMAAYHAKGFREAGAEIVQTNTFGASPLKLAKYGLESRAAEINAAAVRAARRAVAGKANTLSDNATEVPPEALQHALVLAVLHLLNGTPNFQFLMRGPDGSRPDSRILWELSGRSGLFQAEALRAEIAAAIPALANLTDPAIRTTGVLLGAPQPAAAQTT